jgi:uncharacterized protein
MSKTSWSQLGLHVIAKPIGPVCNLRCAYCFYLEKQSLYAPGESWRMSEATLDAYVRQYLEAQPETVEEIDFAFQGGEPTLLGLGFFRRVIQLQQQYASAGKRIHNSLQTNGILLDDRWCEFLRQHNFLVGLSLDGPEDLHDKYRRDPQDRGTFRGVMQALERLRRHGVEFNALSCVHRHNAHHPRRVYAFLRECGVQFMQFIPIVERLSTTRLYDNPGDVPPEKLVSPRSVLPEQFGRFLAGVFEEWVFHDVGKVFVRDFDQALAAWSGVGPSLCVYAEHCGRAVAIEHNGDLYSCDHFVDPPHKLGNIHESTIRALANGPAQEAFGLSKQQRLPEACRGCRYLCCCHGACPKDRFLRAPGGEPGLNYLCAGYKIFFACIDPVLSAMAGELQAGRPAAVVMHRLRAHQQRARQEAAASGHALRRNDPCPCGSGRKFKNCCLRR